MGFTAALDGMLYVFGGADVFEGNSLHWEGRKREIFIFMVC
jgi:hypothetical protein